jgi:[ribosomal protein S5]-alanine N-acetyltransferase
LTRVPELETSRLLLRSLELNDADQIQALFPHWEIVRYLATVVPWPYPPDGALTYIRNIALPAMERQELWQWTLRLKTDPHQIVGSITLLRQPGNNRGFWIGLPWQGQGLMTEAVEVVTDYWFDILKFPLLRVPKAVPNAASRRISEKQGMRIVERGERDYVSGRFPTEIWEITAAEWALRKNRTTFV